MPSTRTFTYIAWLAASLSVSACAGMGSAPEAEAQPLQHSADGFDHGMQVIRYDAVPHTPSYGWRYFSDPTARRAVAISPQGDYYYSCGKGLHWVAAEQF